MSDLDFTNFSVPGKKEHKGLNPAKANKLSYYTTAMGNGSDPLQDFSQSKYNIENLGNDPLTDDLIKRYADEYRLIQQEAIQKVAINPLISPEDKLDRATSLANTEVHVNIEDEYMLEQADKANIPYASFDEVVNSNREAKALYNERLREIREAKDERSYWSAGGDMLLQMVPFAQNEIMLDVAEKLLPEYVENKEGSVFYTGVDDMDTVGYLTSPGDITVLLKKKYAKLPPPEKVEFVREMVNVLKDNAGYTDDSLFIDEYVLTSVLEPFFNGEVDPDSHTGWTIFDNVVNGLDIIGVGSGVKSLIKPAARMVDTPLASLSKANPPAASELAAQALEVEGLAKALNTTVENVTEYLLPQAIDPAGILNIEKMTRLGHRLVREAGDNTFAYSSQEVLERGDSLMQSMARTSNVVHSPQGSVLNVKDGNWVMSATYTNLDGKPFTTLKEASEVAAENFNEGSYTVMRWTRDGKVLEGPPVKGGAGYQYVVKVDDVKPINLATMDKDILAMNDADTFRNVAGIPLVAPSGRLAKDVVGRVWKGLRKQSRLNSMAAEMMRPFTSLKKEMLKAGVPTKNILGARRRITDLWTEGSDAAHTFTVPELLERGLSHPEMKAYYAGIQAGVVQYTINNTKLYTRLSGEGWQTIKFGDKYQNIAKPYKDSDGIVRTVYDPATDSIIPFEKGMDVGKLRGKVQLGDERAVFVKLGDGTELSDLTRHPLKYNEAQISRYYDNLYFIQESSKTLTHNGELITVTPKNIGDYGSVIHGVDSIGKANKVIKQLEADHPDKIFSAVLDRGTFNDIQGVRFSEQEYQLLGAQGNIAFKGRGAELGEKKFKGINADSRTLDPATSIQNAFSTATYRASMEDMINSMKQRWINEFGSLDGGHGFPKNFPKNVDEITRAKAYYNYINQLEGHGGMIATKWRETMLGLGEWMDSTGFISEAISAGVQRVGKKDPVQRLKGVAFNTMIAGNPLRQYFIQTAQYLQLIGADPAMIFSAIPQGHALSRALHLKQSGMDEMFKDTVKKGAKTFGINEKEFKRLLRDFEDSGLVAEIDAHTLAKQSMRNFGEYAQAETVLGKAYAKGRHAVGSVFLAGRKAGFEAGESNARAMTWLMARRMWQRKNKGKALDMDEINNLTEALVFSMNRGDKFLYQDGILSLIMQFFSVQNKAMANMVPEVVGGSKFTQGYKTRIAIGNALMYGTSGLGIGAITGMIMDKYQLPPTVRNGLESGIGELAFNEVLNTDLDWSGNLAPASGIYDSATKFIANIFTSDKTPWEVVPVSHALGRFSDIYNTLGEGFRSGDMWSEDNMSAYIDSFTMSISGSKNAFLGARMAETKHFVDKYGSPIMIQKFTSEVDAIAKVLGVQHNDLKNFYDALQTGKRAKDKIQKDAKLAFEHMKKIAVTKNNPSILREMAFSYKYRTEGMSPSEKVGFTTAYMKLLEIEHMKQRGTSVLDLAIQQVIKGMPGDMGVAYINKMVSKGEIPTEVGNKLIKELRGTK